MGQEFEISEKAIRGEQKNICTSGKIQLRSCEKKNATNSFPLE